MVLELDAEAPAESDPSLEPSSSGGPLEAAVDDYARLQQRLILATLMLSALTVIITALVFDLFIAGSVLVGALAGVLYLRLLARSVSKLGNGSKTRAVIITARAETINVAKMRRCCSRA